MLNKANLCWVYYFRLSKWKMHDFRYNLVKKNFDAKLLITDTDSLIYEIESTDFYKDFFKWKDSFDFSSYSKDSKFFDSTNKKANSKMLYLIKKLLDIR